MFSTPSLESSRRAARYMRGGCSGQVSEANMNTTVTSVMRRHAAGVIVIEHRATTKEVFLPKDAQHKRQRGCWPPHNHNPPKRWIRIQFPRVTYRSRIEALSTSRRELGEHEDHRIEYRLRRENCLAQGRFTGGILHRGLLGGGQAGGSWRSWLPHMQEHDIHMIHRWRDRHESGYYMTIFTFLDFRVGPANRAGPIWHQGRVSHHEISTGSE